MTQFIKFQIKAVNDYILNKDNISLDHQDKEFNNIKKILNTAKNLLDEIPEKDYLYISRNIDSYRTLKQTISFKYHMQIVTNATIKIFEILSQMRIINTNNISAFCNAELPGGFIIGINHYIKMIKNSTFRWVASSYLSEKGTLGDSYGIYEHNINNWLMDETMNGDITDIDNVLEISRRVHMRFPKGVDLYTSDAGFDTSNNYNEQEEQTILLNYGQILTGLLTLSLGGTLITKQFTFFTIFNRSLITLLSMLFNELYIVKPVSSRPLNSEVYLVGIGFKGLYDPLKSYMINKFTTLNMNIPIILYGPTLDILNAADYIYEQQTKHIHYAYYLYIQKQPIDTDYKQLQEEWLVNNPIAIIPKYKYVPYNKSK